MIIKKILKISGLETMVKMVNIISLQLDHNLIVTIYLELATAGLQLCHVSGWPLDPGGHHAN